MKTYIKRIARKLYNGMSVSSQKFQFKELPQGFEGCLIQKFEGTGHIVLDKGGDVIEALFHSHERALMGFGRWIVEMVIEEEEVVCYLRDRFSYETFSGGSEEAKHREKSFNLDVETALCKSLGAIEINYDGVVGGAHAFVARFEESAQLNSDNFEELKRIIFNIFPNEMVKLTFIRSSESIFPRPFTSELTAFVCAMSSINLAYPELSQKVVERIAMELQEIANRDGVVPNWVYTKPLKELFLGLTVDKEESTLRGCPDDQWQKIVQWSQAAKELIAEELKRNET